MSDGGGAVGLSALDRVDRLARRALRYAEPTGDGVPAAGEGTRGHRPKARLETSADVLRAADITPVPWQEAVARMPQRDRQVVAHRQAGKSWLSAAEALLAVYREPRRPVLIVSPSERQSRLVLDAIQGLIAGMDPGLLPRVRALNERSVRFISGARITALPGKATTTRGYAGVSLVIFDEAAYTDDGLYYALRPVLARGGGRKLVVSTPAGMRGWFWELWRRSDPSWGRALYTVDDTGVLTPEFLATERAEMPQRWYEQEYLCRWLDAEDALLRAEDIDRAMDDGLEVIDDGRGQAGRVVTDDVTPITVALQ